MGSEKRQRKIEGIALFLMVILFVFASPALCFASPWADFTGQTIQTSDMTITPGSSFYYNTTYGGSWRILSSGGGFTGSFTVSTSGQYTLQVTHLSSAAASCPGGGYSPVTIRVNGSTVVSDYDPAENHGGSHGMVTDTWAINANAGSNTIQWTAGSLCTHYWIQRIEIQGSGGGWPPSSTSITVDGSAGSGNISTGGDVDWFRFTVSSSGTHTIGTSLGSLSDTYIYLYNSSGTLLEENDDGGSGLASKIERSLSAGTYYVKVRAYSTSQTGSYSIRVTRVVFPPPSSTSVTVDGSAASGNISTGGENDWFRFTVSSTDTYMIETSLGSLSDTYIYLYDSSGTLLEENDDGGTGYASKIERSLSTGTYYVKVRAYSTSQTGSYSISVSTGDGDGGWPPSSTSVSVNGSAVSGNISTGGEVNWFHFTVSTAGSHTIETSLGSLRDTYIYLYNSSGTLLEEDDDGGIGYASKIERSLSAGTYYLKVRAYSTSQTGSYTIRVSTGDGDGGWPPSSTSVSVNGSAVSGNISTGGEVNWFHFTVSTAGSHTIETSLGSLRDTYIYLYNSSGTLLEEDDDGGTGYASKIDPNLSSGTYYVKVRAYSPSQTGSYSISVSTGDIDDWPPSSTPVSVNGSVVSGNISTDGEVNWFHFTVSTADSHTIETSLGSLRDTYIYLYNSSGTLLEEDDDGGTGYASKIDPNLSSGTYYVKVRAYSPSQTGSYSISVSTGDIDDWPPSSTPVTVNGSAVSGNINSGGEVDWFRFTTSSTDTYTVKTSLGSLSDTYIYLYNSSGTLLEEDDDDGSGLASKIERRLSAGTYYMKVRAYSTSQTGSYRVRMMSSLRPFLIALSQGVEDAIGDGLYARYEQHNKKYLGFVSAGAGVRWVINVISLALNLYMDLADYMEITPEGLDGYVTLWTRVTGSAIGIRISPDEAIPVVSLVVGVKEREFNTTNNLPDREFPWSLSLLNSQLPGLGASVLSLTSDAGMVTGDIELGSVSTTLMSASLIDYGTASISFEIQKTVLNSAIASAIVPGLDVSTFGINIITSIIDQDNTSVGVLGNLSVGFVVRESAIRWPSDHTDNSH